MGFGDILVVVILTWVTAQVGIFIFYNFSTKNKKIKNQLNRFHEELLKKEGLPYKRLSFFNLGGISYSHFNKTVSVNLLWFKLSIDEIKYLIAREVLKQKTYNGQGSFESYSLLLRDQIRNRNLIWSLLTASIIFAYTSILGLPSEQLETLHSLIFLPSNLIILTMAYNTLFSKKHKKEKINLAREMDLYADKTVGGGEVYWGRFKGKKSSRFEPSYEDREKQSRDY